MLRTLKLTNFKCFNNNKFEFGNLTFLAGANAAGKSSVIQAILLFFQAAKEVKNGSDEVDINQPYNLNLGKPSKVRSANALCDTENIVTEIAFDNDFNTISFSIDEDKLPNAFQINKGNDVKEALSHKLIYLNAERTGPRQFSGMNKEQYFLGHAGEYTSYVIHQADQKGFLVNEQLVCDPTMKNKFSVQVEGWMNLVFNDIQISFQTDPDLRIVKTFIRNKISQDWVVPTATGFAISYVLPVITAGLLASREKKSVLVIENPEAHLHPYGQSNMGKFLALLAEAGVQVIVETHSEHIIDGARIQLSSSKKHDLFKSIFLTNENDAIIQEEIILNQNGELSFWPEGFFDQKQKDLRELLRLRRNENK